MTGLRQGELLALRWQDVDWPPAGPRAPKLRPRASSARPSHGGRPARFRSPTGCARARALSSVGVPADDDLVFGHPQTGRPLDRSQGLLKRLKSSRSKAAKVESVRFHDLRHTFGTRVAAAGVPMRTLQEWMGHRDFETTLIYADYSPDDRRERDLIARAFATGNKSGNNLSETESNSAHPNRLDMPEAV